LKRHGFLALAGLLVIFWAGLSLGYGAAPKKPGPEKEVPLHITAARLEADQTKGMVVFTGSVKAVYGDGSRTLTEGQNVKPARLLREGFIFQYPTVEKALVKIYK